MTYIVSMTHIIQTAIDKMGGITKLAQGLGISHTAIYSWKQVPPDRVIAIEGLTGIPREDLRPDLYPKREGVSAQ